MSVDTDILVVGTGPAGVSVAYPLAEAGSDVLLIDGDDNSTPPPPAGHYLDLRFRSPNQADWLVGDPPYNIGDIAATSPKTRVPRHRATFADFTTANRIVSDDFAVLGSLASGGLSNAWGCGVARLDTDELRDFPIDPADLDDAYASVCRRIGVSGNADDSLREFFGIDAWAELPAAADPRTDALLARASARRRALADIGARVGRSRMAVLAKDLGTRSACDGSGLCLWGCARGALYSARHELDRLRRFPTVRHRPGIVVQSVVKTDDGWITSGVERAGNRKITIRSRRLVLAAGTLATTRLVLQALGLRNKPIRLLSNPVVAFLLVLPRYLGRAASQDSGFTQVSLAIDGVAAQGTVFGWLCSTTNLPASEFVRYIPTSRATALSLWRYLMPATLAGNCFLPGALSNHTVTLDLNGNLVIRGGGHQELEATYRRLSRSLRRVAHQLGAIVVPRSITIGRHGSDIHYAGTLPMRAQPATGELDSNGQVHGLPSLYVVDGAALPTLSAKPHTLTIMANATRIGRILAAIHL